MSEFKRPLTGIQPATPIPRMISPAGSQPGVSPVTMPMVPNPYGLISAQPHQYMPNLPYTQLPINQNRMPLVGAIPPVVTGMYVPVTQVPIASAHGPQIPVAQVPGSQVLTPQMSAVQIPTGLISPNMDPSKLLEHQKKLEKERNFQLQQQRLKQFTVAGKKGSLNADNLIDSMFGKNHSKESTRQTPQSSSKPTEYGENKFISNTVTPQPAISTSSFEDVQFPSTAAHPKSSQQFYNPPPGNLTVKPEKKDKKELDDMMRECSDLKGPQKANKFSKLPVKEIPPSAQLRSNFTSSNKARDWNNIKGLDEVFVEKRSRFPSWCCKEKIPEFYRKVEEIVTEYGAHPPETNLLFPILISSGLHQQYLAQIWEMVNKSAPGYLTVEEMYAALALIAVSQAGHNVQSVDILHQLPCCPLPRLQCFMTPVKAEDVEKQPISTSSIIGTTSNETQHITNSSSHQVLCPTAISVTNSYTTGLNTSKTLVSPSSNLPPISSTGFISSPDDDFDDFKSATPTCVNFSMYPTNNTVHQDDEFDDFKQAPVASKILSNEVENNATAFSSKPVVIEQDLMSPEDDKYSVFRLLQQNEDSESTGNFISPFFDSNNIANVTSSEILGVNSENNSEKNISDHHTSKTIEKQTFIGGSEPTLCKEDDEFGDFLCAEVKQDNNVAVLTSEFQNLSADFADFSNFNENLNSVPTLNVSENPQLDEDFGDFACSLPMPNKSEIGQDYLFRHLKDNISLAESQSVSSLELGTFDGGGHSGESKSSLSRQGSIPSLDLKSTLEVTESDDGFGELQSASPVTRASKTPSPAKDLKGKDNNHIPVVSLGSNFLPPKTIPLTDKYSVIRSDERKDEDQHISSWTRCLQSSVNILKNTKKIFNQMSCSSICNEILSTEEGENYIKDVIEVYKVACRIKLSSKSFNKQTIAIFDLLKEVDHVWNTISGFFAGSPLMPSDSAFDFLLALLNPDTEDNSKACGLCLLNVDLKVTKREEVSLTLSYGGRNYHSTCANFWVNCVDPLLPALTLPQLL